MLHRKMLTVVRAIVAALMLVAGSAVLAQDDAPVPDAPPVDDVAPRAGRVASFAGDLFLAPPDRAEEWAAIGLNYPIASGDNVWSAADGRAEVDYGGGQFRLGGDTNLHVSRLDDRQMALFVAQGHLVVRVRVLDPGETARIDTPNAQIDLLRPGLYRIDVSPEPRQTWLMVREGEANVALPSGLAQVLPGQTASIAGIDSAVAEVRNGVMIDGLDSWSADRDRVYERGRQTTAYVSRQMVGYADLDTNGRWETTPEYGAVWYPTTVASDWAPYRYGRWVWVATYGWTWVDDASWGYAPFHYGRWAYVGNRWGWCPGAYVARPVWAPALVGWYGGNGWAFSASYGAPVFGWVPLGWRDPYVPGWGRCGARCYERYNRPYAVNVAERGDRPPTHYANGAIPGAVTAVPGAAFREARPVQANRVPVTSAALSGAPLLRGAPAVKPLLVERTVRPGGAVPRPAGLVAAEVRPSAVAPVMRVPGGAPVARPAAAAAPALNAVGGATRPTIVAPARSVAAPVAAPPAAAPSVVRSAPPAAPPQGARAAEPGVPMPATRTPMSVPVPLGSTPPGAVDRSTRAPMPQANVPAQPPAVPRTMQPGAPAAQAVPPARFQPAPGVAPAPAPGPMIRPAPPPMQAAPPAAVHAVPPPPVHVAPPAPVQVAPPPVQVAPGATRPAAPPPPAGEAPTRPGARPPGPPG